MGMLFKVRRPAAWFTDIALHDIGKSFRMLQHDLLNELGPFSDPYKFTLLSIFKVEGLKFVTLLCRYLCIRLLQAFIGLVDMVAAIPVFFIITLLKVLER